MDLDIPKIFQILEKHQVEFIVIGGVAAIMHGVAYATYDVDITPNNSSDNIQKLIAALKDMNARLSTEDHPEGLPIRITEAVLHADNIISFSTKYGVIDIIYQPTGSTGYTQLYPHSVNHLLSLEEIIRLKQITNRPKDQLVLTTLRNLLTQIRNKKQSY